MSTVGSPFWIAPESLHGKVYDETVREKETWNQQKTEREKTSLLPVGQSGLALVLE